VREVAGATWPTWIVLPSRSPSSRRTESWNASVVKHKGSANSGVVGERALIAEAAGQRPRGPDLGKQAETSEGGNDLSPRAAELLDERRAEDVELPGVV
jgi:hypothetical protein